MEEGLDELLYSLKTHRKREQVLALCIESLLQKVEELEEQIKTLTAATDVSLARLWKEKKNKKKRGI